MSEGVMTTLPGIRQSDLKEFQGCRQKWEWSSSLRRNLRPLAATATHFWYGTMMHAVLEDFHGPKRLPGIHETIDAVFAASPLAERPEDYEELRYLGHRMMAYYTENWLVGRDDYRTLVVDGQPQVEVSWSIPVEGIANPFTGTFDRVVEDRYGNIWILDYKFMKTIETEKLENDFQVTHYLWAANQLYGKVEGLVYLQFAKVLPVGPERLKRVGKDGQAKFSQDKSAPMTRALYEATLLGEFGTVPDEYVDHLNWLSMQESADGDGLIRRSIVRRGSTFLATHEWNVRAQAAEMTFPQLAIYPSPSAACKYCPFRAPCLAKQDDADYEFLLRENFTNREDQRDWQDAIVAPEKAAPAAVGFDPLADLFA